MASKVGHVLQLEALGSLPRCVHGNPACGCGSQVGGTIDVARFWMNKVREGSADHVSTNIYGSQTKTTRCDRKAWGS